MICIMITSNLDLLFQKLYTFVPDMVKRIPTVHFVDASNTMSQLEHFVSGTGSYLLLSQDRNQTFWHQDFSATSVLYTVPTGKSNFFLLTSTEKIEHEML